MQGLWSHRARRRGGGRRGARRRGGGRRSGRVGGATVASARSRGGGCSCGDGSGHTRGAPSSAPQAGSHVIDMAGNRTTMLRPRCSRSLLRCWRRDTPRPSRRRRAAPRSHRRWRGCAVSAAARCCCRRVCCVLHHVLPPRCSMPQSLLRCVRSRSLPPAQCEAGDAARCVAVDSLGERAGGASRLSDPRTLLLQARRKLDAHRSRRLLSSLRILPVEHSARAARPAVPSSH